MKIPRLKAKSGTISFIHFLLEHKRDKNVVWKNKVILQDYFKITLNFNLVMIFMLITNPYLIMTLTSFSWPTPLAKTLKKTTKGS